ncbi:MAG: FimB/Mfa2 family fimbrial subunit, partial [Rikenellaceae bacterium]|nr:FimB/Mfa2 family fimbrial subunit [Rikenellaceae bacterium]
MNKITTLLIAVGIILAGCARRTDTATFSAKVTLELDIPEMITSQSIVGGAGTAITPVSYSATEERTGSQDATSRNAASSDAVSSESALSRAGASTEESITSRGHERDLISEVSFYIFDDTGDFISKSTFAGADSYSLDLPKNGRYTIYAMCNMSGMADMPEACSQSDLEAMTVSHRESYDMLPFAGKTQAVLSADNAQSVRIPLNRLNSAIRIENRDVYRMELTKATVSGLPSCANIFDTGTEAPGVTYDRTARATVDADGNAIVYSFLVPEERMADVRIEAEATLKNASADKTSAIASLSFMERLEAGRQSEALVGYT